jgi:hypothetical protein
MTTDERMKLYYEYRYLVDDYMNRYSPNKPDYEDILDLAIGGLFLAIDSIDQCGDDFKSFALFHIKSFINNNIAQ